VYSEHLPGEPKSKGKSFVLKRILRLVEALQKL
jgi:hypothetical protein